MYAFNKRLRLTKFYGFPPQVWLLLIAVFFLFTFAIMAMTTGGKLPIAFLLLIAAIVGVYYLLIELKNIKNHLIRSSLKIGFKDKKRKDFYL